ncbi:MAG: hypothetical protein AAF411_06585 [Myxococcota bacterium]
MNADETESEDKPPILGSWRNIYAAVLLILVMWISLFYWITRTYSASERAPDVAAETA